jgi:hypothetical protein
MRSVEGISGLQIEEGGQVRTLSGRGGSQQLGTIHVLLCEIELLQNQCARLLTEKPPVLFNGYSDSANFK